MARMYDYYLCGTDNFEADRIAAEQVLAGGYHLHVRRRPETFTETVATERGALIPAELDRALR